MALDDNAVLVAGSGAIWYGNVGAPKPTLAQLNAYAANGTMPTGWTNLGHTSDDDLPTPGEDDGETTTLNSWQSHPLRTRVKPGTTFWDVTCIQLMDNVVMQMYFGGGTFSTPNEFIEPDTPVAIEKAVTMVMIDGSLPIGVWYPKMSIYHSDVLALDSEAFTEIPLRFTKLKLAGQPLGVWIGAKFGTP